MSDFLKQISIYQDDDILVVNKPAGLLTIPGKEVLDSLLTRLKEALPEVLLIHRLDRDTSGLLVFALNKKSQTHISKQFQSRTTDKIYEALVCGHLSGRGEINIPVVYDATRPPLHIVDKNDKKPALTYWQSLECFELSGESVTRVQLQPITGRSHQLRVHLQYLGHSIVGDTLYTEQPYRDLTPRLCLHAKKITLQHPGSLQQISFEVPADF